MNYSTGLVLSIAKEIIQDHGGSIVAQNDPTTGGARIQVPLPRQKKAVGWWVWGVGGKKSVKFFRQLYKIENFVVIIVEKE